MRREKRTAQTTVHMPATIARAVKLAAATESRTFSDFVLLIVKRHLEQRGLIR